MRRWMVKMLVGLAAGMFAMSVVVWVRSYFAQDIVVVNFPGMRWADGEDGPQPQDNPRVLVRWRVVTGRGGVNVQWMHWEQPGWDGEMEPEGDEFGVMEDSLWWDRVAWFRTEVEGYPMSGLESGDRVNARRMGFQWVEGSCEWNPATGSCRYVGGTMPLGVVALVIGLLAWPGVRRLWWEGRRRRWQLAGCCERCGYDLRASAGRCPECGAAITKRTSSTML